MYTCIHVHLLEVCVRVCARARRVCVLALGWSLWLCGVANAALCLVFLRHVLLSINVTSILCDLFATNLR